jgi:(p)ppGpp synthase/HD superfamily hydrolase
VGEIYQARDFALRAHGDQKYGDLPYGVHLFDVVQVLRDFDATNSEWKAGFLHDVLEDTATTSDQILDLFGEDVLRLVYACTGEGKTRYDRNQCIYERINAYPPAAKVKLADRIANVEAATPGDRHWRRYKAELDSFRAVIRPHVPASMWARLERNFPNSPETNHDRP